MGIEEENFLLELRWSESQDVDFEHITKIFLDAVSIEKPSFVSVDGKGWPGVLTRDKFEKLLAKKGIETVDSFALIDDTANPEGLSFYFLWSRIGKLGITTIDPDERSAIDESLATVFRANVEDLEGMLIVAPIRCRHGLDSPKHLVNQNADKNSDTIISLKRFDFLQCQYTLQRGYRRDQFHLFIVTPDFFAPRWFYEKEVSPGISLRDWIQEEGHRGVVSDVTSNSCRWSTLPENIELVTRELWPTGFIIASDWTTIVGWNSEWNTPRLQFRPDVEIPE